jgi:hypothetical protein
MRKYLTADELWNILKDKCGIEVLVWDVEPIIIDKDHEAQGEFFGVHYIKSDDDIKV